MARNDQPLQKEADEEKGPAALSQLLRELVAAPPVPVAWAEQLEPGQVIGRFELVRELGRGGFGVVFEARDLELGRSIAFKAVCPGTSPRAGEQLMHEAEAIARLAHPNLVTLFDAGRCDRGPFLVLELLRGRTLRDHLGDGPVPLPEALRIATGVARGLAHAHGAGVIHRDLKPSNVFVCDGGLVKLLDFGLSHAFGRERPDGGTPAYMAPEQRQGGAEDERTDVFALGVLLHRMLSGTLPFGMEGSGLDRSQTAPPLEPLQATRSGPDVRAWTALADLVQQMLQIDVQRRPRDAREVAARLDEISADLASPVSARPRRRALVLAGLVGAALIGAVSGTLALLRASPPAGPPSIAVLPFESLSASKDDSLFAEGVHGELITQLARLSELRVIARGSVRQYAGKRRDLRAIAAALGVSSVLDGTIQRAGERVRVAVQLVDARSGTELWSDRFDRKTADLFQVETAVALEIAAALGAKLSAAERIAVSRQPTRDREAHDLFLRGRYYWERSIGVESDNRTAADLIEKAVARDPSFAIAQAFLASIEAEWRGDCEAARLHAARSAAISTDTPELHLALGRIRYYCDRDARAAIREYEQAVREAPGDAVAHSLIGSMRTLVGDYDAGLDDLRLALVLDPRSYIAAIELARELVIVRRVDEATGVCARARELAPGDVHALVLCSLIPFWRDGDASEARRALSLLPEELPSSGNGAWSLFQLLAIFPDEAVRLATSGRLREPFATQPFIPRSYVVACAHAAQGSEEAARPYFAQALPALERHARGPEGDPLARLFAARAYAGLGRPDDAVREARQVLGLAKDPERRSSTVRLLAEIAAAAGRRDDAITALRELLSRRDGLVTPASVRADPRFASLRGDAAFDELLSRPFRR